MLNTGMVDHMIIDYGTYLGCVFYHCIQIKTWLKYHAIQMAGRTLKWAGATNRH